jgi:hypothetical protein
MTPGVVLHSVSRLSHLHPLLSTGSAYSANTHPPIMASTTYTLRSKRVRDNSLQRERERERRRDVFQILLFLVFPMRRTSEKKKCFLFRGESRGSDGSYAGAHSRQPPIANHCPPLLHRQHKKTASPWVSGPLSSISIQHHSSSACLLPIISNHTHSPLSTRLHLYLRYCDPVSLSPSSDQKASQQTCKSRWF